MAIIFLLLILSSCTSLVLSTDQNDVLVLLKIKEQLGNPDFLSAWVDGFDFCNNHTNDPVIHVYVSCTSTGRVNAFSISIYLWSPLSAPFPQAICDLTELEYLSLYNVPFFGPITCVDRLINLREISLSRTFLGGPIPEFPNHNNLTSIYFDMNSFSGSIPPSLSKLPNLKILNLRWNFLTGSIPPGLVPSVLLDLSENGLTGKIPRCYEWVNFSTLILRKNQLSGDASFLFGLHKTVTYMDLSYNQLAFDLSDVIIPEHLFSLDLSFNQIYGKVPKSIASASELQSLDLKFNSLCGEIPQGGFMSRFNSYDHNRCLCGTPLPPCYNSAPAPSPLFSPPFYSTP
ncbi:polygalacturonase inhibitor 1-like [Carex rostrata]